MIAPSCPRMLALLAALAAPSAVAFAAGPASAIELAQAAPKPEMVENCPGLVAAAAPRAIPAALRLALEADQVRLTYVGHSTFLIESPQLVRVATDYNDYVPPPVLPDLLTLNPPPSTPFTPPP